MRGTFRGPPPRSPPTHPTTAVATHDRTPTRRSLRQRNQRYNEREMRLQVGNELLIVCHQLATLALGEGRIQAVIERATSRGGDVDCPVKQRFEGYMTGGVRIIRPSNGRASPTGMSFCRSAFVSALATSPENTVGAISSWTAFRKSARSCRALPEFGRGSTQQRATEASRTYLMNRRRRGVSEMSRRR